MKKMLKYAKFSKHGQFWYFRMYEKYRVIIGSKYLQKKSIRSIWSLIKNSIMLTERRILSEICMLGPEIIVKIYNLDT